MTPDSKVAAPSGPAAGRSVGRAVDLLEFVLAAGETTLTEAADAAGLTPTTALRYLKSLETRGFLQRSDHGLFSAGPGFLRLAALALAEGPQASLISMAGPRLRSLADGTGESCYLAIANGDGATYIATAESQRAIRHTGWVGKTVPMAGTAVGEALGGHPGVCFKRGSVESEVAAVAVGVRNVDGLIVGALSVIGPTHRMNQSSVQKAGRLLLSAAKDLTVALGSPGGKR